MFYALTCGAFCPYRLFCSDLQRFWRYWLLRCLPPLKHNGTRWHSACGAQNAKKINLKYSTARSQLLKIFHRPCCERPHVGRTFCLISAELHPQTVSPHEQQRTFTHRQKASKPYSSVEKDAINGYILHYVLSCSFCEGLWLMGKVW